MNLKKRTKGIIKKISISRLYYKNYEIRTQFKKDTSKKYFNNSKTLKTKSIWWLKSMNSLVRRKWFWADMHPIRKILKIKFCNYKLIFNSFRITLNRQKHSMRSWSENLWLMPRIKLSNHYLASSKLRSKEFRLLALDVYWIIHSFYLTIFIFSPLLMHKISPHFF